MYKEKLAEQITELEVLQMKCSVCDVSEFIEIGRNILLLAKKIDDLETEQKEGETSESQSN